MTDPAETLRQLKEDMRGKAEKLYRQMQDTDVNGRVAWSLAEQHRQKFAEPTATRVEQIDRLMETASDGEREALERVRDAALAELPPGPGDGGARQPLPAPSLQQQADQAAASGDHGRAMSIKSQMLGEIVQRRNEGN